MPNYSVFNNSLTPIYSQVTNTYSSPGITAPPENNAGATGNLYTVTATNSGTLGLLGGSIIIALMIANPAASGKTLYVSQFIGGTGIALNLLSSFTGTLTLTKGGTLTSPTTLTPVNTNFSSTNTSVMTASSSTSAVSGGTVVMSSPLNPGAFSMGEFGKFVVPPGQSIAMTVSAALTVAGVLSTSATISWWEA